MLEGTVPTVWYFFFLILFCQSYLLVNHTRLLTFVNFCRYNLGYAIALCLAIASLYQIVLSHAIDLVLQVPHLIGYTIYVMDFRVKTMLALLCI